MRWTGGPAQWRSSFNDNIIEITDEDEAGPSGVDVIDAGAGKVGASSGAGVGDGKVQGASEGGDWCSKVYPAGSADKSAASGGNDDV